MTREPGPDAPPRGPRGWWQAVSAPEAFFRRLEPHPPRLLAAGAAALASGSVGLLVLGLAVARATASDPLLLAGAFLALGLGYLVAAWLLGGIALTRPAGLDLRAWEVAAWAWVPAGFLGVSLLPVAWFFPLPSLAVGLLALPLWHLWIVFAALRVLAPARVRLAGGLYLLVVFVFPLLVAGFTLFFVYQGTVAS